MRYFLYLLIFVAISCGKKSQETKVDLSSSNISYQEGDKETGWKRVLLIKPNKWGFIDDQGEIKIPFIYDFINPFEDGVAYVKNGNKNFFMNPKNEIVIKADYDKMDIFSNGFANVETNKKVGYINRKGELVIPLKYDTGGYFNQNGLAAVSLNKKWGFINGKGEEVIPIIYEMVKSEQLDDMVIVRKNYKWAFFDNKGNQLSDFLYANVQRAWKNDRTTFFENGPASVKKSGKYLFLSKNLKPAFGNRVFDSATSFDSNNNAIVMNKRKFGMIKSDGKIAFPLQYDLIENYNSNGNPNPRFYFFEKGNRRGLFNKNLKKIAEAKVDDYSSSFALQGDYISFQNFKGKYGLIDAEGNVKIPFIYDEGLYFDRNDFSIAKKNNRFGIINLNNVELTPISYLSLYPIFDQWDEKPNDSANYFVAKSFNGPKIIDLNNKTVLSGYDSIDPIFNDHFKFIVQKNKKFGIIDLKNIIILPIEYDKISNWTEYGPRHSKFIVKNKKTGLIDHESFKVTIPPVYDKFLYLNGLIFAKKNGKEGIITEDGKVLCDFIYDEIYPNASDFYGYNKDEPRIYARKGNSYFQIDAKGKVLKSDINKKTVIENSQRPAVIYNQVNEPSLPPKPAKY